MKKSNSNNIIEYGIYEVNNDYINHLRKYDNRVEKSDGDSYQKERKYLAVKLNNGENYLIPFSSPKDTDYINGNPRNSVTPIIRITSKDTSGKIQVIGKLKNSSMIPIKNIKIITKYDITKEKDSSYKDLMQKEIQFIEKNKESIKKAVNEIYNEKLKNINRGYIKNTVDFKKLEKAAIEYSLEKSTSKVIENVNNSKSLDTTKNEDGKIKIKVNRSNLDKVKVKAKKKSNVNDNENEF